MVIAKVSKKVLTAKTVLWDPYFDPNETNFVRARPAVDSFVQKAAQELYQVIADMQQRAKQNQKTQTSLVPKKCRGGAVLLLGSSYALWMTTTQCQRLCEAIPHLCRSKTRSKLKAKTITE